MSTRPNTVPAGHEKVFVGHVPPNGIFNVVPTASGSLAVPCHASARVVDHPRSYAKIAARANFVTPHDGPREPPPIGSRPYAPHETAEGLIGIKVGDELFMSDSPPFQAVKRLLSDAKEAYYHVHGARYDSRRHGGINSRQFSERVGNVNYQLTLKYAITPEGAPYELTVVAVMDNLSSGWPVLPVVVDHWNARRGASAGWVDAQRR